MLDTRRTPDATSDNRWRPIVNHRVRAAVVLCRGPLVGAHASPRENSGGKAKNRRNECSPRVHRACFNIISSAFYLGPVEAHLLRALTLEWNSMKEGDQRSAAISEAIEHENKGAVPKDETAMNSSPVSRDHHRQIEEKQNLLRPSHLSLSLTQSDLCTKYNIDLSRWMA